MWRWRDWVIDAFNGTCRSIDSPSSRLPATCCRTPTLEQQIATGFNRNHRGNAEGGIIPEEYAVEYVVDRVDTTATVWLGLTLGCARCHDHKYDPITQKEFYQLFAYFNNVPESGKARRQGNSPPFIKAPTADQVPRLQELDRRLTAATDAFAALEPELVRAQQTWERTLDTTSARAWGPTLGLVAHYPLDGDLSGPVAVTRDGKPVAPRVVNGEPRFVDGRIGGAAGFDGKGYIQGGDITGFDSHGFYDDKYSLAAWIFPTAATGAIVTKVGDTVEPNGHGLHLKDGKVQSNYVSKWVDEGIRVQSEKTLSLNAWHQITLTYDGSRYAEGAKLYVDGELWKWEVLLDDLNNPRPLRREPLRIGGGGGPDNRFQGAIDDVRIYSRDLTAAEAKVLADPSSINAIASMQPEARSQAQSDKIRDYFLANAAPAAIQQSWKALLDVRAERNQLYESLPTVMVMEEMATPRQSHLLVAGSYRPSRGPCERRHPCRVRLVGRCRALSRQPARARAMADQPVKPAGGTRRRQPVLADVFRHRSRQDRGGLRLSGRGALASGAARLAGH